MMMDISLIKQDGGAQADGGAPRVMNAHYNNELSHGYRLYPG